MRGCRLIRFWRGGAPEEPLKYPSKITADTDPGEALHQIGFRVGGRARDMERNLRVARFGSNGKFLAEQSAQSTGQFLVEEEARLKVQIAGGEDRPLCGQDEIFRTQEEILDNDIPGNDTKGAVGFRQAEELEFIDLQDLADLSQEINGLNDRTGAVEQSLSLAGRWDACDASEIHIPGNTPFRGRIAQ